MYVHSACTACMIFNNFHSDMETVVHASDLYGGAFVVFVRKKTSWPESRLLYIYFVSGHEIFDFEYAQKLGVLFLPSFFGTPGYFGFWISDFGSLTWSLEPRYTRYRTSSSAWPRGGGRALSLIDRSPLPRGMDRWTETDDNAIRFMCCDSVLNASHLSIKGSQFTN